MKLAQICVFGLLLPTTAAAAGALGEQPAQAPAAVQKICKKMLDAIEAKDRDAFVADSTEEVKEGVTAEVMAKLSKKLGARLKKGYDSTYLCQLKQLGYEVHLWKLTFKDAGDDVVIRMAMKEGKVAGFFLQ